MSRQCRSRNRAKYIYINFLLYNHDKQTKKTFTQKYKFEIINSTSVSDNSFFPPLRKVQSCIVLKAIYESQRRVGRRKGFVAGNRHAVISEENHRAEDQKLRSPLGNATEGLGSSLCT